MASATIAFANPWHDEIGRFAPKGTGSRFDAGEVRRDAARARALVESASPIVKNKANPEAVAAVEALQAVGRSIYDAAYATLTPEQVSILNGEPTLDPEVFAVEHDAVRGVEQILAERTMEMLRDVRPFGNDPEFKVRGDEKFVGAVEAATGMYPTAWYAATYGVAVAASGTTGGWYDAGTIGLPNYSDKDAAGLPRDATMKVNRSAVHELGHHLEEANPVLLKSAQMYLATRKRGAMKPGTSVGHKSSTRVVNGEFRNPYTGLFYGSTEIGAAEFTEVLTTHMYSFQFALDGPGQPTWSMQDSSLFSMPHPTIRQRVGDAWSDETMYALGVLASL